MKPSALLGRLWRAQLRLKVMAGVVIVTLVAIVAFDFGAVTIMRRYLFHQTDANLQLALTLNVPKVGQIIGPQNGGRGQSKMSALVGRRARGTALRLPPRYVPVAGGFDMAFLPFRGAQVTLEVGANSGAAGQEVWTLSPSTARIAVKPGPHTVVAAKQGTLIRLQSRRVPGGDLVIGTSLDQVDRTLGQFDVIVTVGSIALVLLIGAGVFLVLRRGLRPIEAMAGQADRITAGDLTERVTAHNAGSEVRRLGTALNGMLARIETSVHEREAGQEQMRQFFADASHELRTPLASLRANAELYQQGALDGPEEVDEVMDRIVLETRRMGRLVDDMLRLARLGQHPGQSQEPVDVSGLVRGCADRVLIADPERVWRVRVADDLTVIGDEELLRRAVDNLLMNVLVHTCSAAAAAITASAAAAHVSIEVSDDGPGVPPDKLPHIFERFYRAGSPSSRPGSGLGLAIVAEVAAAHGGSAQATTVAPHGLRVTLTVPAARSGQQNGRAPRAAAQAASP